MCDSQINDIRTQKDFKNIVLSGFKKVDVKKELLNSFINNKLEPVCYWTAELICSGHFYDIWEIYLLFYSKYIHVGNPKLANYLNLRINNFKELIMNGYSGYEINLRNNNKIRKLFSEIACVLCESERKHSFDEIKISSNDFNVTEISNKLKAPNINYLKNYYQDNDPKELFIACNELSFHLSIESKNAIQACYWCEWIIEFESICKRKKNKIFCERRNVKVETIFQKDVIWLVWDAIIYESDKHCILIKEIIKSLFNLFILKYTNCNYKKKKFLIYVAISILTEQINLKEDMIKENIKKKILIVTNNIDNIYKQIKQNEISLNMDYLFKNIKQNNLEKTIIKLNKMNEYFTPQVSDLFNIRDEI